MNVKHTKMIKGKLKHFYTVQKLKSFATIYSKCQCHSDGE